MFNMVFSKYREGPRQAAPRRREPGRPPGGGGGVPRPTAKADPATTRRRLARRRVRAAARSRLGLGLAAPASRAAAWLAGWSRRRGRGPRGANRGARGPASGAAGPPQLLAATSASPGSAGGREGASRLPQRRAGPPAGVWLGRCAAAPGVAAGRARRWWERWAAGEERRRCHRRQLRNMAAQPLLGGKAGLPRAPRLPLPAGRPRAAA